MVRSRRMRLAAFTCLWSLLTGSSNGLAQPYYSRRAFLVASVSTTTAVVMPLVASAATTGKRYVLNEDTGEYDQVEDPSWQDAWKDRLDKAQSMSTDEVFMAARGAGNTVDPTGENMSESSKKRRAMAACRDDTLRSKSTANDIKECTARVFNGETDFILKVD